MKQLLFLLLFPCFALAQYPGNAGQKITLGEQTTADGLVYRGLTADTTRKPSVDTMAFILLDTNTNIIWQYKKAVNNAWTRVGGSISSGVTGVLPVANGGTNASTLAANKVMVGNGTSGVLTPIRLHWDNTNFRLGVGLRVAPQYRLHIASPMNQDFLNYTENDSTPIPRFGIRLLNLYEKLLFNSYNTPLYLSSFLAGGTGGIVAIETGVGFGVTTERMRVNASGNVGIGTASPQSGYKLHVVDSVYVGGRVSAAGYTTRSDYNLKDEIQTLNYGLNEVIQMQPVKYTYKSNGEQQLGFIAQDIGTLIPESVHFDEFMGVDYQSLIPILTKAIQEQQAIIKALEQRILILENK